jgi:hypothetical protein
MTSQVGIILSDVVAIQITRKHTRDSSGHDSHNKHNQSSDGGCGDDSGNRDGVSYHEDYGYLDWVEITQNGVTLYQEFYFTYYILFVLIILLNFILFYFYYLFILVCVILFY